MPSETTASVHPSVALGAWAEPLVRGRRVAVLGDARIGLASALAQRGARLVHAYDPDPARVSEALSRGGRAPGVSIAVLEGDLGVRDGAFDVVMVPDLSLFADPGEIVRRARRLAASSGAAVFATPNPAASKPLLDGAALRTPQPPGYYELFDLVALQFSIVRMVGQAPFVGYTVAEFSPEGEPAVTVDTSLLSASEEPEWFLAVASERAVEVEPYAVVELPMADVPVGKAVGAGRAEEDRAALAEAQARLALVTAELEKLRERQKDRSRDIEAKEANAQAMGARLVELEKEVAQTTERLRETEARAGDAHVRAERLSHRVRDLEEELRAQRDRGTRLTKQLDDEKRARQKAELELGMIRGKPEISGGKDRIDALSAELESARGRIVELEQAATVRKPELAPETKLVQDPALVARVAELEAAIRDAQHEVIDLAAHRDAAEARAQDLAREIVDLRRAQADATDVRREKDHAERRVAELERRMNETIAAREADLAESQARDVASLEEALRERAHAIDALRRDLRESERVGRELLEELLVLREASGAADAFGGGAPAAPPAAPEAPPAEGEATRALRGQLDALATKAARCEADLQAASWRIVQLEQRLAEHDATPEPGAIQSELEQALVEARREVALLRRAVSPELDPSFAATATEQLVLLEQVAADRAAPAP